jgi:hypothetical protein
MATSLQGLSRIDSAFGDLSLIVYINRMGSMLLRSAKAIRLNQITDTEKLNLPIYTQLQAVSNYTCAQNCGRDS